MSHLHTGPNFPPPQHPPIIDEIHLQNDMARAILATSIVDGVRSAFSSMTAITSARRGEQGYAAAIGSLAETGLHAAVAVQSWAQAVDTSREAKYVQVTGQPSRTDHHLGFGESLSILGANLLGAARAGKSALHSFRPTPEGKRQPVKGTAKLAEVSGRGVIALFAASEAVLHDAETHY